MTQALFWLALPCLLPQAVWVRRVTPRFRAPTQTLQGRFGTAPKLRVVGIGDSIIAGVGASTAERTLTAALANALHQRLSVDTEWSAFGKIGADTAKISRQVAPRLPVNGADLVLISAGVNDITGLRRRRDWLTSIEQLLTTITTRCPRAVVLIQGLPPLEHFPALPAPLCHLLGSRVRYFEAGISQLVTNWPQVRYAPITVVPSSVDFASDGFHPGESSYQALANVLADHFCNDRMSLQHFRNEA